MNDFNMPDSWYEPVCHYETECTSCTRLENTMESARDFLKNVLKMLYGRDELDIAQLDDQLGELANQLDLEFPVGLPNVARKDALSQWIEFNNNYLKKLA